MRLACVAAILLCAVGCRQLIPYPELTDHDDRDEVQQVGYRTEANAPRRLNRLLSVPLDRSYDLHCLLFESGPTIFRNCRILGLVGREDEEPRAFGSKSEFTHSDWYDGMLVLETDDGRRVYVPTAAVRYFEEARSFSAAR